MHKRTCTIENEAGKFCDKLSSSMMPFPICADHAIALFKCVDAALRAARDDDLGRLIVGFEELDELRTRRAAPMRTVAVEQVVYYLMIDGVVKIGYTNNLQRRLAQYPPTAQLLGTESGDRGCEAQRHQEFREYLTAGREWFTPGPRLREHIQGLADYRAA